MRPNYNSLLNYLTFYRLLFKKNKYSRFKQDIHKSWRHPDLQDMKYVLMNSHPRASDLIKKARKKEE